MRRSPRRPYRRHAVGSPNEPRAGPSATSPGPPVPSGGVRMPPAPFYRAFAPRAPDARRPVRHGQAERALSRAGTGGYRVTAAWIVGWRAGQAPAPLARHGSGPGTGAPGGGGARV